MAFFKTVAIIAILWISRQLLIQVMVKRITQPTTRTIWRQIIHYGILGLGIIFLFRVWFSGFQSILTFLGLVAAAMTIALKEPLQNLFAWAIIIWRELFSLGDRIEVGDQAGDVIDMGIFYFTLLEIGNWVGADQSTGRVIKVPNSIVLLSPVANYSRGLRYIWNEFSVRITGESDWKQAKDTLLEIALKHSIKSPSQKTDLIDKKMSEQIRNPTSTPTVYCAIDDHGIKLTLRYLCSPQQRRESENIMWEEILLKFATFSKVQIHYKD